MKSLKKILAAALLLLLITGCSTTTNPKTQKNDFTSGEFEGSGEGLHGEIKVKVTLENGVISKIDVVEQNENQILGVAAFETITQAVLAKNSTNVDTVSGSTATSVGFIAALNEALKDAKLVAEKEIKKEEEATVQKFDVVIVGGGGAGLAAAIEAAEAGASVIILEKAGSLGGNTLVAGGYNGSGTSVQKGLGIPDTSDILFEDTMKGGDYKANPELVRVFADNAGKAVEWTVDHLGVELRQDYLMQFDIAAYPRAHITTAQDNSGLIGPMIAKVKELNVTIKTSTPAVEFIVDGNKVTGVKATRDGVEYTFEATKGVVLATGGFGANFEMVEKYDPTKKGASKTTNVASITGDGIIMAEKIGAHLVGMEYVQTNHGADPVDGSLNHFVGYGSLDGGITVDLTGERFLDEGSRRDVASALFLKAQAATNTDRVFVVWGNEVDAKRNNFEVNQAHYQKSIANDTVFKADTLEEAAKHYGINYENLVATIERYNTMVEKGVDEDFGRTSQLTVIKEGPYYIGCITPSVHHTMGGVEINTQAQVINESGEVIENLFAAGEVTGGIHGSNRLGGNAVADALVFGRIAGQKVVELAK